MLRTSARTDFADTRRMISCEWIALLFAIARPADWQSPLARTCAQWLALRRPGARHNAAEDDNRVLTGTGVQDTAIASLALARARALGTGILIDN